MTGLVLLVPLVIIAAGAWHSRFMSDDGFIDLRVVREVLAGHGPVFNPGERVEASTSPLWIAFLVVGDVVLPLRLEWIAVLMGITLTVLGVGLTIFGAIRLSPDVVRPRTWWLPVGALLVAVMPPMWKFASSGLENGLSFAWLGGSFAVLAVWSSGDRRLRYPAAVLLGLGPLVRPEIGLFTLAFLGVVLAGQWRDDTWARRLALLGAAFALPFAYEVFRMGFFASLVPNSALAKEASRPYWSSGWHYLRQATEPYVLWIPLVLLAATAYVPLCIDLHRNHRRRGLLLVIVLVITALVDAIYIIRVGGDFMRARLLLPALFALAAPVAVVPFRRAYAAALLLVPWAFVALVWLRSPGDSPATFGPATKNLVTAEQFGYAPGGRALTWYDGKGVYFLEHKLPATPGAHDPGLTGYGVGILAYSQGADTYVLDLLGLGDAFTSHLKLVHRGVVAHEKPLPFPWIAARLTSDSSQLTEKDFTLPKFFVAGRLDHPGGEPFQSRIADARKALQCGELKDFITDYSGRLDVGRFVSNVGDAFRNYTFRIPPEPRDAVARYCRSASSSG